MLLIILGSLINKCTNNKQITVQACKPLPVSIFSAICFTLTVIILCDVHVMIVSSSEPKYHNQNLTYGILPSNNIAMKYNIVKSHLTLPWWLKIIHV